MSPIRRVFPKKRGTILTDYGKKRERFESDIATINVKYGTDFEDVVERLNGILTKEIKIWEEVVLKEQNS